jgi:cell division protein FtsQ
LRANVAPQLAGNFFTVDLARARTAFESVPWVRKAVVRREFPNKLRATLTEHVPVAHWGDEAGSKLINGFGEVFEANVAEVDDKLPRLDGPSEQAGRCWACTACWRRCSSPTSGRRSCAVARQLERVLDSGPCIELGRGAARRWRRRTQRFLAPVTAVARQYGRPCVGRGRRPAPQRGYALRCAASPRSCRPKTDTKEEERTEGHSMPKDYKDLVVGLDIGTAKVMVVVAEVLANGELKLAGLGVAPSNGLKRGVVVNIDATVQSIQQALKEAELMADCKIAASTPASPAATSAASIRAAWWR